MIFGQTFDPHDMAIVGLLIVLEGVLSIDNALVLGLLAKRLPKHQQARALTYGLVGAFVFRIICIALAAYLLSWRIVKLLGGAYLIYVAAKHFFFERKIESDEHVTADVESNPVLVDTKTGRPLPPDEAEAAIAARTPPPATAIDYALNPLRHAKFWPTVLVIELTDIAFAVDSILAAIAMVPSVPPGQINPKLWVVIAGGMIGLILMRFAAIVFIKLLERFPRFEISAYLLVFIIGAKLVADWYFNEDPVHPVLNFHHVGSTAFWVFWGLMLACFAIGFIPKRRPPAAGVPREVSIDGGGARPMPNDGAEVSNK